MGAPELPLPNLASPKIKLELNHTQSKQKEKHVAKKIKNA